MTYAFNTREVAEALVHVGNREMARKAVNPNLLGTEIITVKTPLAGIDARVGIDCSSAECNLAYVNKSDELVDDPNVTKVVVYNTTEEDIAGGQYIAATRQRGVWVASVNGGGGGGGGGVLCKAPIGGIPARTGDDASQTDCDVYEINAQSGAISSTGQTVNIYNIWSQSVAANAYFTAKTIDGLYVPDAEDCTGN